jgi:hypothetical protein
MGVRDREGVSRIHPRGLREGLQPQSLEPRNLLEIYLLPDAPLDGAVVDDAGGGEVF